MKIRVPLFVGMGVFGIILGLLDTPETRGLYLSLGAAFLALGVMPQSMVKR